MVKKRKKHNRKKHVSKGFKDTEQRARKINASTVFETCTEQISPFGGLLGLIKFLDLVGLEEVFDHLYIAPQALLPHEQRVTRMRRYQDRDVEIFKTHRYLIDKNRPPPLSLSGGDPNFPIEIER